MFEGMLPLAAGVVAALLAAAVGWLPAAAVFVLSESLVPLPHAASMIVLSAASSAADHRSFLPLGWLIFKYVTLLLGSLATRNCGRGVLLWECRNAALTRG